MAIGMTYEQYWYGDPLMVRAFIKAHKIRQQKMNEEAWLQGAYVLRALDVVVGNAFRKKGQKPSEYPKEPIAFAEEELETEEERERKEEQNAVFARAYMSAMVHAGKDWGNNQSTK